MTAASEEKAIVVTPREAQPSRQGPAENFTGSVRVDQQFQASAPGRVLGARVTFEPGARTAWHSHPLGQTLIVTSGVGRVQRWGDPVDEIRPGDLVWIPAGQKHWHGASPTTAMTHIAIVETLDGKSSDWMEKVTDEQYGAPVRPRPAGRGGPGCGSRRPADAGAAHHGRLRAQAGAAHRRRALRRRVGAPAALPARPQPRDDQRAHRHEPARPAPLAPRPRPGQRRHRGGDRRVDHAPGLLRGLAERGHGGDGGEGSLREEVREAVAGAVQSREESAHGKSARSRCCADRPCSPSSRLRASSGTASGVAAQALTDLQTPDTPLVLKAQGSFFVGGEKAEQTQVELGGLGPGGPHHRQPDVRAVHGAAGRRRQRPGGDGPRRDPDRQVVGDDAGRSDGLGRVLRAQGPSGVRAGPGGARAIGLQPGRLQQRARGHGAGGQPARPGCDSATRSSGRTSASARSLALPSRTVSSRWPPWTSSRSRACPTSASAACPRPTRRSRRCRISPVS